jgi:hypothetical protein
MERNDARAQVSTAQPKDCFGSRGGQTLAPGGAIRPIRQFIRPIRMKWLRLLLQLQLQPSYGS